jgi:hypothetical protein
MQNKDNNMKFEIEEDFANDVLKYLMTKPFNEVYGFVEGFKFLKPIANPEIKLENKQEAI